MNDDHFLDFLIVVDLLIGVELFILVELLDVIGQLVVYQFFVGDIRFVGDDDFVDHRLRGLQGHHRPRRQWRWDPTGGWRQRDGGCCTWYGLPRAVGYDVFPRQLADG